MNSRTQKKFKVRATGSGGPELNEFDGPNLVLLPARLLTVALPSQRLLHPALFARLQVVGMPLDFLDDVFLLDLPFEPAQGVFKRFSLLQPNFGQV